MKKLCFIGLVAVLLLAGSYSCSTDIDINADNLETPIVYCILNTSDSVQYVRLQKTYLIDQAALEYPPHPDSMVFPGEIVVTMERLQNDVVLETYRFLPTTEITKDSGFFPTEKHVLYKANAVIKANSKYRLYIYLGSKEKVVYAQTSSLGKLTVVDPMNLPVRLISLYNGCNYTCRWEPVEDAGLYQVVVKFRYSETRNGITTSKHINWSQDYITPGTSEEYLSKDISGARLAHILDENLMSEAGIVRTVEGVDFQVMTGAIELKYYMESTAPTEGALMEKPVYTNIINGLGVFSTISEVDVNGLFLSGVSIDSIAYGQYTRDLGFLDHTGDRDSTNEPLEPEEI
ncbi:MAG: hypothetical protein V2A67_00625 [Bacteroidota bacterium]